MSIDNVDSESDVLSLRCERSYTVSPADKKTSFSSESVDRAVTDPPKNREPDIFELYDQGPSMTEIEQSQYKITHVNRYGFILGIAGKHSTDDKIIDESEQIKRWGKFLNNWDISMQKDKKSVRRAVLSGIPDCLRSQVWKKLLKIDEKIEKNVGVYQSLKRLSRVQSKDAVQIDKDVERTYRTHIGFNVRYSVKQRELFNLLLAYSIYDKKVGYCQGMNEIAATLLMYLTEEETFWAMTVLTLDEIHNLHGFYCENFPKLVIFETHLERTMDSLMPDLMGHFKSMDFDLKIVTTKWFLLCFINSLPFSMVLRVWDRFMLEGSLVLYPIAFAIFKCSEKMLLKMAIDEVAEFFKNISGSRFDIPRFFQKLEKYIQRLKDQKLYPIPGVAHDAIDIDVSAILASDVDQTSCNGESHISKNAKPYHFTKSYFSNASNLKGDTTTFNPREKQPPVPDASWEDYFASHKEMFIKEIDYNDLDDEVIEIEKIASIIASVAKG